MPTNSTSKTSKAVAPKLSLAVQYATAAGNLPQRAQLRRWAKAALAREARVTLRIVGQAEGRRLNRDFRGKDYATNVLSFPYEIEPVTQGDLVICPSVVAREAQEQGKPLDAHYAHLTVHGMLHLQGWDHEDDDEAQDMEDQEREILAALGYPDPYAGERAA
jgi:probable rRNA maturation factor